MSLPQKKRKNVLLKEAAQALWAVGDPHEEGRRIENPRALLVGELGFSNSILNKLIKRGALVRGTDSGRSIYYMRESYFLMYGYMPTPEVEVSLRQRAVAAVEANRSQGAQLDSVKALQNFHVRPQNVALLIDWDNVVIALNEHGIHFNPGEVMKLVLPFGDIVMAQIFANVDEIGPVLRTNLADAGFEVVDCPPIRTAGGRRKDRVDKAICDRVTWITAHMPSISTVVLATADHDFLPSMAHLKKHRRTVAMLSVHGFNESIVQKRADFVIPLEYESSSVLEAITPYFKQRKYDLESPNLSRYIHKMGELVVLMHKRLTINSAEMSFAQLRSSLMALDDYPSDDFPYEALLVLLTFFVRHGILRKKRVQHKYKIFYHMNLSDPFVQWSFENV